MAIGLIRFVEVSALDYNRFISRAPLAFFILAGLVVFQRFYMISPGLFSHALIIIAIIHIGHNLRLKVIAEGVETEK